MPVFPKSQLPYHYFYIKPRSKLTQNYIQSSIVNPETGTPYGGAELFTVKAKIHHSTDDAHFREFNLPVLSRGDGQYVVQLKIRNYVAKVIFTVAIFGNDEIKTLQVEQISGSDCDCPTPSLEQWLDDNKCQDYLRHHEAQLDYDFSKFDGGLDLDHAYKKFKEMQKGDGNGYAVCKYRTSEMKVCLARPSSHKTDPFERVCVCCKK